MSKEKKNREFLPLAPIDYHILLSLIGRAQHGYAIMLQVESEMGIDIPTPKIYRYLRKLSSDGLIEVESREPAEGEDPRRRYYRITGVGQEVCRAETQRLTTLVSHAQGLLNGC